MSQPAATRVLLLLFAALVAQGGLSLLLRVVRDESDWAHPLLHLVTGGIGIALARRPIALFSYATVFGVAYGSLGIIGALADISTGVLPLGPADHIFHVLLGAFVVVAALLGKRQADRK